MLKPLTDLNDAARRAAAGTLDHRVPLSGADDEFSDLGKTFNEMLAELERAFDANERFAANASHELRTPLSTTKLLLDVERTRNRPPELAAVFDRLSTMNDRTLEIVGALLDLADATSAEVAHDHVDLDMLVAEALSEASEEAHRRKIDIVVGMDSRWAVGDRILLGRVISNLIHNAVQHNIEGGHVQVRTRTATGGIEFQVENSGPMIDEQTLARLQEPFYRSRGRISTSPLGFSRTSHGLGLALVGRIVDSHDGRLTVEALDKGGLRVSVFLPKSVS